MNSFLYSVHTGLASVEQARAWIAELRSEGLGAVAELVEDRLPWSAAPPAPPSPNVDWSHAYISAVEG